RPDALPTGASQAARADVAPPAGPEAEAALALDKKLIAEGKAGSEIMKNLSYLSDVIGARLTGSENLKRANEWAAEKMKSYGLSNVHLEPWTIPAGWQRGTATARLIEPDNGRTLTVASMGWTPGTKGPIEGDVVVFQARTKDDLVKYKGKLKNAILLQGQPAEVAPITDPGLPYGQRPERRPGDAAGGAPGAGGPQANRGGQRGGQRGFGRFGDPQAMEEFMRFRQELREFLRAEGVAATLMDSGKPHGLLNMTGGWRSGGRGGDDRASAPD